MAQPATILQHIFFDNTLEGKDGIYSVSQNKRILTKDNTISFKIKTHNYFQIIITRLTP